MSRLNELGPLVIVVDHPTAAHFAETIKNFGAWEHVCESWRATSVRYLVIWQRPEDHVAHTCTPATDAELREILRRCLLMTDGDGVHWSFFVEDVDAMHNIVQEEALMACTPRGNA